ncbi:MAG TPA: YfhO family protein [Thermoleophilaceae bacterium]|nr:YfhO family protein [Thermoleophilaceae bacterium]
MATSRIPIRRRAGSAAEPVRSAARTARDRGAALLIRFWPLVFLAVAIGVYYWPVIVDGRLVSAADILGVLGQPWIDFVPVASPSNTALLDSVVSLAPAMTFVRESLAAGQLPLWSPYTEFGVPFLAQSQWGTPSPVQLPFLLPPELFSIETAQTLSGMLKIAVAGAGAYALGRVLDFSKQGAIFSAIAYMLGGYTVAWLSMPDTSVTAFLPWMALGIELVLFGRRPWLAASGLGVAMAFAVYGGHPEVLLYQFAGFVLYGAFRAVQDRRRLRGQLRVRGAAVGASIALSGLLSALVLLPAAELYERSIEATSVRFAPVGAFVVDLGTLERLFDPVKGDTTIGGVSSLQSVFNVYTSLYVGIAGAVMAILALLVRDRRALAFWAVAALGFALSVKGAPATWVGDLIPSFQGLSRNHALLLWTFGLAMAAGAGVDRLQRLVAGLSKERLLAPGLALLLCVAVFADLYDWGKDYNPRVPKAQSGVAEPAGYAAVPAGPGEPRAAYLGPAFMRPLVPQLFGRTDIRGYGQPTRLDYEEFIKVNILPEDPGYLSYSDYALGVPDERTRRMYSALNVGYYVSRGAKPVRVPGAKTVERDVVFVQRNPDVKGRAWFAQDHVVSPTRNSSLYRLNEPDIDPTKTVVLTEDPSRPYEPPVPGDRAEVVRYENQGVEIRTDAAGPRLLFMSDSHYPGWKAEIDGEEVEIQRADGLFRAVSVPAGEHTLRFLFRPASVLWGFILTLLGAVLALALALFGRRRVLAPAAPAAAVEPGRMELRAGGAVARLAARVAPAAGRVARARWTAPALLVAALVFYYWEVFAGQLVSGSDLVNYLYPPWSLTPPPGFVPSNPALADSVVSLGPAMSFVRDSIWSGQLPLWNPYTEFGNPFWAQSQWGLLSPVHVPYLLPEGLYSIETAQTLVGMLKIGVAISGAYLLARRFALSKPAAAFAGIAYGFGGYTTVWLSMPDTATTVFLPWVLLAIEWVLTGARPLLGAAGLALLGFAAAAGGHPEKLAMATLGVLVYVAVRLVQERRALLADWRLRAFGLAAGGALAVGLFAVVLLPAIELFGLSGDSEQREALYADQAFSWKSLIYAWAPDFAGNPTRGTPQDTVTYTLAYGPWYAGVLAVPLALVALARRDRRAVPFAAVAVFGLVVAMNTLPWRIAIDTFPTLGGIVKQHVIILWFLGLVMAAAIGVHHLQALLAKHASRAWIAPGAAVVLCVALFAELYAWGHEYNPRVKRDHVAVPYPPELDEVDKGRGAERTIFLGNTTRPLLPMSFDVPEIRGYGQPTRSDYDNWMKTIVSDFGGVYGSYTGYETGNLRPNALRALSAANVGFSADSGGQFPIEPLEKVREGTLTIHRNPFVKSRASLYSSYEVAPGDGAAVQRVANPRFDARRTVVLDADPGVPEAETAGSAEITRYENNRVTVRTETSKPEVLVLSDSDYPGWSAEVDGEEAEIHRANGLFRAVVVPAGEHTVEFTFRPKSLVAGFLISLGSLLLVGLLAHRGRKVRVR